ncbi:MAG: 3-dehydroquinate synthase [Bacteroidales bacterium]|nr:3-dehydroquinate synthase [Bacteroidales bacterium]MBN2755614.1 3-dehydroquinate synthase [Bacteroidales bacterium]
MSSKIIFSNNFNDVSDIFKNKLQHRFFLLADENTDKYCMPLIKDFLPNNIIKIKINSGENNKNINSIIYIWQKLTENNADRKSTLINLGGGVICDLGGFAASTYKRGIDFVNIPTSLLAQVDASIGGKTGFDFMGYKNQIGSFNSPLAVFVNADFLKSLNKENLKSGFAEMIKHALVFDTEHYNNLIKLDFDKIDYQNLLILIKKSISIKEYFVEKDPFEKNIRKTLNFGHTAGHAFESYFLNTENEIAHGYAVAFGIIIELILSYNKLKFQLSKLKEITDFIIKTYGKIQFNKNDYEALFALMKQDKKNENNEINFTLLSDIGKSFINSSATKKEIFEAFDYYFKLVIWN